MLRLEFLIKLVRKIAQESSKVTILTVFLSESRLFMLCWTESLWKYLLDIPPTAPPSGK